MWDAGKFQFVPFIVTVIGVVGIDLLKGSGDRIGCKYSLYIKRQYEASLFL
jgi:hypothetical protein